MSEMNCRDCELFPEVESLGECDFRDDSICTLAAWKTFLQKDQAVGREIPREPIRDSGPGPHARGDSRDEG